MSLFPPPSQARILLADDNADMRDYVTRLLRGRWSVETVDDGATALARAWETLPDLILSDIMMPGLDGPEALRVLVVDDNEDAADLLVTTVRLMGHLARVAHDGPTALRIAADFQPHVALLDIGLPVMDGYELARHLRALPGLEAIRLIAVTGYSQEADRRQTAAAGFERHLVKPIQLAELQEALAGLPAVE